MDSTLCPASGRVRIRHAMTIQINTSASGTGQGLGPSTQDSEYYILCPQRATEVPGLITHLISRDICQKRQSENYHKCTTCIRSAIYRARNGMPTGS